MLKPTDKAKQFAALHSQRTPLILCNVWDAGSAKAVSTAGVSALATGSFAVAGALGYDDGEQCPLDAVLTVLAHICRVTDLPVSHDLERGYGASPQEVANSCRRVIKAGAVGINLEDGLDDGIRNAGEQTERVQAASEALSAACENAWLNARCDAFLAPSDRSSADKLDDVLIRAEAYTKAGANSLFVPGLQDLTLISELCCGTSLPVNIMRNFDGPSLADLADAGVARISHGPFPWRRAMELVQTLATQSIAAQ